MRISTIKAFQSIMYRRQGDRRMMSLLLKSQYLLPPIEATVTLSLSKVAIELLHILPDGR